MVNKTANKINANLRNEKDSRFDFLKVISTLFIIGWHIAQHSSVFGEGEWSIIMQSTSIGMITSVIVGTSGQIAVTIFIIISSWFMAERRSIKSRKIIRLMIETSIFSLLLYIIVTGIGLHPFSLKESIKELITPLYTQYWFITCYCIYYFIVPLLNEMFSKKSTLALKNTCLVLTILIPLYNNLIGGPFGDFCWFIYIHIVVLYLKRTSCKYFAKLQNLAIVVWGFWTAMIFIDLTVIRNISEKVGDFSFGFLVYRSLPVAFIAFILFFLIKNVSHHFTF